MKLSRPNRRAALRLLLGSAVLALAACGRKGAPLPPPGADPCYPRHYPMDETTKQACAQKVIQAREEREKQLEEQQQKSQPQAAPAAPAAPESRSPATPGPATPAPATPSPPQ